MKKTVSILIITLLVTSGLIVFINFEPKIIVSAKTLYVGGTGPGNWTEIHEAIENASDGDTVFVYKGIYCIYKNIYIFNKINLIGEDRENTILDGSGDGFENWPDEIVYISANDVTVTGFNITRKYPDQCESPWTSIRENGGSNCVIYNNIISESRYGIEMFSNNHKIFDNIILNNYWVGVGVYGSNNLIYHNTFINNGYKLNDCQAEDGGSSNSWDDGYPSGGNYWDDYSPTAPDLYSGSTTPQTSGSPDGICDNPYNIDSNTKDFYPLKIPFDNSSGPPSAPTGLLATKMGNGWLNFTWTAARNSREDPVAYYRIYKGLKSNEEKFLTEVGTVNFYNDTNIENGITYYYKVSARNAAGEGPLSEELIVTPLAAPTMPLGLKSTIGDSYNYIFWDPPNSTGGREIANYKIYRSEAKDQEELLAEVGNVTNYNDTSVTNGITYFYKIKALNEIGLSPFSDELESTPGTVPTAPVNFNAKTGNSYVYLTWEAPLYNGGFSISNYNIYRSTTINSDELFIKIDNVLFFNDTEVSNGDTYYYKISAVNTIGEGDKSFELNAAPGTVPSVPKDLNIKSGNSWVYLDWQVPDSDGGFQVLKYNIYRRETSTDLSHIGHTYSELFFNDTEVTNGITYYYVVTAVNMKGESSASIEVSAAPYYSPDNGNIEQKVPSAPINLEAFPGYESVTLTWEPPLNNGGSSIIKYFVYRQTDYSSQPTKIELENNSMYVDIGLSNDLTYYYSVSAVNAIGEGQKSIEVSAVPTDNITVPTAPQNLLALADDKLITLTWNPPLSDGGSVITNYEIYRRTSLTGKYTITEVGNVLTWTDTGLEYGQTYYYRISAVNIIGEGPRTDEVSIQMFERSPPSAIRDLKISFQNGKNVLIWSPPDSDGGTSITNYKIYKSTSPGTEVFIAEIKNVTYFFDDDVSIGGTYYYKVSAKNGVGEGELSNEVNITPAESPKDAIKDDREDSSLIWSLVIGVTILVAIVIIIIFLILRKRTKSQPVEKPRANPPETIDKN